MSINYIELAQLIRSMNRRSKLYLCLKSELSKLGYWKLKSRGKSIDEIVYNKTYDWK
jgi:hypothetical protein